MLAQHFHFPLGRGVERHDVGLVAELISREVVHELTLCCQRLAQSIQIISPGFQSDDNWFHLAPGVPRKLRLVAEGTGEFPPRGSVIALNGINPVEFGSPS